MKVRILVFLFGSIDSFCDTFVDKIFIDAHNILIIVKRKMKAEVLLTYISDNNLPDVIGAHYN